MPKDVELVLDRRRGSQILLVEDNAINQDVATHMLQAVGMSVDVAENGQEAVERAGGGHYDLILMDVQMPVMDGLQAAAVIRRLPGWREIPILAVTANAFEEDRNLCLSVGMNDHIAKPVEPHALYRSLVNRNESGLGQFRPIYSPAESIFGSARLMGNVELAENGMGWRSLHADRGRQWRWTAR